MTDITGDFVSSIPTKLAEPARGAGVDRMPLLRLVVGLAVALLLVVPESEIRAKSFKLNLIMSNVKRAVF